MAFTNFGKLTTEQATVWSRDTWREVRNTSFVLSNFAGNDMNSMIQRITELKETKQGTRAVITLVPDLEGDGVVGDNQLEGNEEEMKAYDQVVDYDQIRNAHRLEGRMADLRSTVQFRTNAKNLLSYWGADRVDELAFLTMSGVSYSFRSNGAVRVGSQFPMLSFAANVTAPTANRHFRWSAADGLVAGATNLIEAADTPSWEMLVALKAQAEEARIRPIRTSDGIELYNVFMSARGIAALKKDDKFRETLLHAQKRGDENPLFKGTKRGGKSGFYLDGLNIVEYRHVYNTKGAASGSKWGATGTQDGQRVLLCGAQALAIADIGLPKWVEKDFDYDNSPGVSLAKLIGLHKPKWRSSLTGTVEDFSILAVDTAI